MRRKTARFGIIADESGNARKSLSLEPRPVCAFAEQFNTQQFACALATQGGADVPKTANCLTGDTF